MHRLTQLELPFHLLVDRPLPDGDDATRITPAAIKSTITGKCVIIMASTLTTITGQQHADGGRWTTRRVLHAKTHRATLTRDILLARGECIEMCYQQTSDGVG